MKSYAGAGNAFVQTGSINVVTGSVVYLPGAAAATRPGYQLVGWYETNDYIDYVGNDSITLYNNVLKTDPKFHAVGSPTRTTLKRSSTPFGWLRSPTSRSSTTR